jgi:hypothetical protein
LTLSLFEAREQPFTLETVPGRKATSYEDVGQRKRKVEQWSINKNIKTYD